MVLNRECIIDGFIELKEDKEKESALIISKVKEIMLDENISDIEKIKMINTQICRVLVV